MSDQLKLGKYSVGMGDRFTRQTQAQLRACLMAAERGVEVIPVWNKSHREHQIVGSEPADARAAADAAVKALGWTKPYHVDADHVGLKTVDRFLPHCDFFTIDVAEYIGQRAGAEAIKGFVEQHVELNGRIAIAGSPHPFQTTREELERIAGKYLLAVSEAGKAYRHIAAVKGAGKFITEISMDEADSPQTPVELVMILAAIADEGIPIQTIAPRFIGRFNKGVDYVGGIAQFERKFIDNLHVIMFAVQRYGLPANLKLSIHSGSDKFSLYPAMRRALVEYNVGVHLKTSGTTWLEEVIGLAASGGEGLAMAKAIYGETLAKIDENCGPYATVVDIDRKRLPTAATVEKWSSEEFVAALRHDPQCLRFNPHLRQLLHVGYREAVKMGRRYLDLVKACEAEIAKNVTGNLFERHIRPLFVGE